MPRQTKTKQGNSSNKKRKKVALLVAIPALLFILTALAKFIIFKETDAGLEAKLDAIQTRIIIETKFGKEMAKKHL